MRCISCSRFYPSLIGAFLSHHGLLLFSCCLSFVSGPGRAFFFGSFFGFSIFFLTTSISKGLLVRFYSWDCGFNCPSTCVKSLASSVSLAEVYRERFKGCFGTSVPLLFGWRNIFWLLIIQGYLGLFCHQDMMPCLRNSPSFG